MKRKLHPHLKSFIRSVVQAELAKPGDTKRNTMWAEKLFRDVEDGVLGRISEIETQDDLRRVTREEVSKFQVELKALMDLVGRTLEQVPLDLLKSNA
jgi:hypothetical protein